MRVLINRCRCISAASLFIAFLFLFSSCRKTQNLHPSGAAYLLRLGLGGKLELMNDSRSWMPWPEQGRVVFANLDGEEQSFRASPVLENYTFQKAHFPFRQIGVGPKIYYRTEHVFQKLEGDRDLDILWSLGVFPWINDAGKHIEWEDGIVCADMLRVLIKPKEEDLDRRVECWSVFLQNDRGFSLAGGGLTHLKPEDIVVYPEEIELEQVVVKTRECAPSITTYVEPGLGVRAFRDSEGVLWLFDRIEEE
ncbi:MAG: hypothetical protein GYB31_11535 [Bacteroidetes bacterium]|nr:hypothetical protein [Bacteroidota bacterium]